MTTSARRMFANGVVIVLVVLVLAAILFPVFAKAKVGGRPPSCLSKMRQLGVATFVYAADADEVLPLGLVRNRPSALGWAGRIYPYTKNAHIFRDAQEPGAEISYAMNANVVGGGHLSSFQRPGGSVMLFEVSGALLDGSSELRETRRLSPVGDGAARGLIDSDDPEVQPIASYATGPLQNSGLSEGMPSPRHNKRSNFLFGDGSAKALEPSVVSAGANASKVTDEARPGGCTRADGAEPNHPCAAGTSTAVRYTFSIR